MTYTRPRAGLWLAACVAVGACAPSAQQERLEPSAANASSVSSSVPGSSPTSGDLEADDPLTGAPAEQLALGEAADPLSLADSTPPGIDPSRLLGLNPATITSYLGEPTFLRLDGPALMHRYESKAENEGGDGVCVAEIYYYQAEAGGEFRAQHVIARWLREGATTGNCLAHFFLAGAVPMELSGPVDADAQAAPSN